MFPLATNEEFRKTKTPIVILIAIKIQSVILWLCSSAPTKFFIKNLFLIFSMILADSTKQTKTQK